MTATYLGIKGTHGTQEFLPNTYPLGRNQSLSGLPQRLCLRDARTAIPRARLGPSSCVGGCIAGSPRVSSTRSQKRSTTTRCWEAWEQPRARNPAASSTRNLLVAQNWLDLSAERGLSTFDQRHLVSSTIQYTTGMGMAGGTLLSGWRGTLFKGWMFTSTISAGSGLPLTPLYPLPEAGHRRHRCATAQLHGRAGLRRSAGVVPESGGLFRAASRSMGQCRAGLHHWTRAVHLERFGWTHLPID